ncbi:dTDP-4-dehydrorhamnose 3,5-epimerase [Rhizobium sp. R86522]|uniref:dTDP-4-dehydrorhamnose 3,5-epimerase n=1 Tax=Rhizobium sp. R86522 TaxID=3093861 RepID=UPI00366D761D
MKIQEQENILADMCVIAPTVYRDNRGCFFESWNEREFSQLTGANFHFVQDNRSVSKAHVLRGLHYQVSRPQGKIVTALKGTIFDVAVDLRKSSPTFGKWFGIELSGINKLQVWIPPGFAHGFLVCSPVAEVAYKTTDYYSPKDERCIVWNDPVLDIDWQARDTPILSSKDAAGDPFELAELFE